MIFIELRMKLSRLSCQRLHQFCTSVAEPLAPRKPKSKGNTTRYFVDFRQVKVKGGDGGNGCLSFLSLPYNEWAGPDGGDGGNGGHVIFQADENINSLAKLKHLIIGPDGEKGRSKHCHGKNAKHSFIKVPIGTVIKSEDNAKLGDLDKAGDIYLAARGGAGGHGNKYYLSNENRAPTVYEEGGKGEERKLYLELKVMAHAGLIGFPNAGKSTLLRAMSRARPKVASYPFTTLNPHIGMVQYDDLIQISVADIPGLVKGAHLNYGIGFSFLRHIERCRCLFFVLDLSQDDPLQQLDDLRYELDQYSEGLSQRPNVVVANKIDLPYAEGKYKRLKEQLPPDIKLFSVSARNKTNILPLLKYLRYMYDEWLEKDEKEK